MNEYRQNAINHLKTHLGCVGYRDYLIAELEKLEKIEQVIKERDSKVVAEEEDFDYLCEISSVIEKE